MRAATAEMLVERGDNVAAARVRVAVEQRFCGNQDSGQAVAALPGLLVEECLLQRMRRGLGAESFDGGHRPTRDRAHFPGAGIGWLVVDQHHAAPALFQAAAVARAHQPKMVAQNFQ